MVSETLRCWQIPEQGPISATFHGRDLFAPQAAKIANGMQPDWSEIDSSDLIGMDWSDDLAKIVYIDSFGNLITGVRANALTEHAVITLAGNKLNKARTFSDVAPGDLFWYENSFGLIEVAANQGNAAKILSIEVGCPIQIS